MIFEDVLRDLLVDLNVVGRRVFLMRAPQVPADQAIAPYIVYLGVGVSPLHAMNGPLDVYQKEYQISIFDTSQSRALAIADTLRAGLDGLRGYYEGVEFGSIFYRALTSAYEEDTRLFQVIPSFQITYRLPVPLPATARRQHEQITSQRKGAL